MDGAEGRSPSEHPFRSPIFRPGAGVGLVLAVLTLPLAAVFAFVVGRFEDPHAVVRLVNASLDDLGVERFEVRTNLSGAEYRFVMLRPGSCLLVRVEPWGGVGVHLRARLGSEPVVYDNGFYPSQHVRLYFNREGRLRVDAQSTFAERPILIGGLLWLVTFLFLLRRSRAR